MSKNNDSAAYVFLFALACLFFGVWTLSSLGWALILIGMILLILAMVAGIAGGRK